MFSNTPSEFWKLAYEWLRQLGQSPNKKFLKNEITTHPEYPALTSLTDFLDQGGMEYNAVSADISHIHEFNYPLLAHIKDTGLEYLYAINKVGEWDSNNLILSKWSGIVIYPEKKCKWENAENDLFIKARYKESIYFFSFIIPLLVYFVFTLSKILNISFILFGISNLLGLIFSFWVNSLEIGVQNNFIKQVCGAVSKDGCHSVLKSVYAKAFAGFSVGDLASIYFISQFVSILISSLYIEIYSAILFVCMLNTVVAIWSLFTQAFKIKKWCALCLGIVFIIIIQSLIAVYSVSYVIYNVQQAPNGAIVYLSIYLIVSSFFIAIKNMFIENRVKNNKVVELKKWKMDADIFMMLWKEEQQIEEELWENELVFGSRNAPIRIIVACNPYCDPCARAHIILDQILDRHKGKVKVAIRFLCHPDDEKDKQSRVVRSFLQLQRSLNNESKLLHSINDWFNLIDYEKWVSLWPITNIDVEIDIKRHRTWFTHNDIKSTPTFFINSRKLPGRYGIDDFNLLIPILLQRLSEE